MTHPASSPLPAEPRLLQRRQCEPHPPGPPWPTAAQNTFSFLRKALDFLLEMRERYGDVVSVPTLVGPFTLIFHPDGVRPRGNLLMTVRRTPEMKRLLSY